MVVALTFTCIDASIQTLFWEKFFIVIIFIIVLVMAINFQSFVCSNNIS